MSIGLYQHPHLGLVRRYILNNKYVFEREYDHRQHRIWALHYSKFESTFLKSKEIQFIMVPEEVFMDSDRCQEEEDSRRGSKKEEKIVVIYEHYPLTLGDELRKRIENKEPFTHQELWYFMYTLVQAAQELTFIHSAANPDLPLLLHPQTVLLNERGQLKLICFESSPTPPCKDIHFQTPTVEYDKSVFKKTLLQATFAVGRIMASLILLKELRQFDRQGSFDRLWFEQEWSGVREKLGVLGRIVVGMLQGLPSQRILLPQISALLFQYQECMLNLQQFRLDRQLCRKSMLNILVNKIH